MAAVLTVMVVPLIDNTTAENPVVALHIATRTEVVEMTTALAIVLAEFRISVAVPHVSVVAL